MERRKLLGNARQALAAGQYATAADWLHRYRDLRDRGDRQEQGSYWALVGALAYETGVLDRALEAFDHLVEITGYYDALGARPDLIAFHREEKGLLPVDLPDPAAPGPFSRPGQLDAEDLATLQSIHGEASALATDGEWAAAIRVWEQAWAIVPVPRQDWSWAARCYAGIGESFYQLGDAPTAELAFRCALDCDGGEAAAVLARLAQCAEARGDEAAAEGFWERAERLQPGIADRALQED